MKKSKGRKKKDRQPQESRTVRLYDFLAAETEGKRSAKRRPWWKIW